MAIPRIKAVSTLRFTTLREIDGTTFWDLVEIPDIPVQPDDLTHIVRGAERIDELASRYYEEPTFWRLIAAANDMDLVPSSFSVGTELRIPSPRYVRELLFTSPRTKT